MLTVLSMPCVSCTCRCLTWSLARSFTFLRTRRRVDRLPRSCPTSSSTARLWNSLVQKMSSYCPHCSFLPQPFIIALFECYTVSSFSLAIMFNITFLSCPSLIHSHVIFKRSNLSACFNFSFHWKTFNMSPFLSHDGHPQRWRTPFFPGGGKIRLLHWSVSPRAAQQTAQLLSIKEMFLGCSSSVSLPGSHLTKSFWYFPLPSAWTG